MLEISIITLSLMLIFSGVFIIIRSELAKEFILNEILPELSSKIDKDIINQKIKDIGEINYYYSLIPPFEEIVFSFKRVTKENFLDKDLLNYLEK